MIGFLQLFVQDALIFCEGVAWIWFRLFMQYSPPPMLIIHVQTTAALFLEKRKYNKELEFISHEQYNNEKYVYLTN